MERTGRRITGGSTVAPRAARRLWTGLTLLSGALMLGGCYVVPASYPVAETAYVAPAPAYVAPAPVYVAPPPVYVAPPPVYFWGGYGYGYGWRRYGRYGRW
jgi:hypothetical protein